MTLDRDEAYLVHIANMMDDIRTHLSQGGRDAFLNNITVQQATLRSIQLLTESTKRLSDNIKSQMPNINWKDISGFRNILVHDYMGDLDYNIVWKVIETKLPELEAAVKKVLEEKYDRTI